MSGEAATKRFASEPLELAMEDACSYEMDDGDACVTAAERLERAVTLAIGG